jgi:hypothetical protein
MFWFLLRAALPGAAYVSTVLHREATHSVLEAMRRRGVCRDFPTAFSAAAINESQDPVPLLESYKVEGRPVFWFAKVGLSVVVDRRVFGGLKVVDATSLAVGEVQDIGRLTLPAKLPLPDVAVLLVTADVVLTYAHIGSSLSMVCGEEDGAFRAEFTGHHVYYTTEENRESLHFEVRIGPLGEMAATGLS